MFALMQRVALWMLRSWVLCLAIIWSSAALAEPITIEGVSFEPPRAMVPQPVRSSAGPVMKAWKDNTDTLSMSVAVIAGGGPDLAKELEDWPSVGRSFVNGFGESNAKALGQTYGAKCSFTGSPLMRDSSRMMMGVEISTNCQTSPQPTVLKSRVIVVATSSNQVILRIDALPNADTAATKLVSDLWKSIGISEQAGLSKMEATAPPVDVVERTWAGSVSGGHGVHLVNYDTIRPAALVGQAVGTLLGAILFGWIFTLLLMWLRVPPVYAVPISQLLCIGLTVWGTEHDGNWTLNPAMWLLNGVAAAILLRPARRRWQKKHPPQALAAPAGSSLEQPTGPSQGQP